MGGTNSTLDINVKVDAPQGVDQSKITDAVVLAFNDITVQQSMIKNFQLANSNYGVNG